MDSPAVKSSDLDIGKPRKGRMGKEEKKERYDEALSEYLAGKFSNLKECARHFDISYSTLHTHVVSGDNFGYVGSSKICMRGENGKPIVLSFRPGCVSREEQLEVSVRASIMF